MASDARVGPYRILRLVNRGGQGTVYLGYDERLRRRVAIKIYPLPTQRASRKRLLREAQVVASLESPKIVQIYDVIESSTHLAMVMEYVPGCDLEELLRSVRLSLASILTIAGDLAAALSIARQQRIVHGDLKAANVLIAANGGAKLTDFGIARRPANAAGGSPSALTPEHILGQPLDERSDLFALGCLLYRMLAGAHPFFREGELDTRMLLENSPSPLRECVAPDMQLAPELADLVDNLLQKDPRNRPANPRIVRQTLRQVARTMPLAAGNNLLAEARPYFRAESTDDIPPAIPADLGREGRSRLTVRAGLRQRILARGRWPPVAAVVVVTGLAVAGIVALRGPAETAIHIDAPVLRLGAQVELPDYISSRWLVREVTEAVGERLGPLRVSGPIGATPVTAVSSPTSQRASPEQPAEHMHLGLRCVEILCVFAVTRTSGDRQFNGQAVLFPDMPVEQWRDIVRSTAAALYQ